MTDRPTPAKVWGEMVRGNARFVAGEPRHPRQDVERRNELAEERADVNAREEVALTSGTLRRARVVAELRVIQRQLHELRNRNRSGIADARDDEVGEGRQKGPADSISRPCDYSDVSDVSDYRFVMMTNCSRPSRHNSMRTGRRTAMPSSSR